MMDFVKKLRDRYHYSLVVLKELVKTDFKLRPRVISWHRMVRPTTVDAVLCDVRRVRQVPAHV